LPRPSGRAGTAGTSVCDAGLEQFEQFAHNGRRSRA
jgi:hypothetical protein